MARYYKVRYDSKGRLKPARPRLDTRVLRRKYEYRKKLHKI